MIWVLLEAGWLPVYLVLAVYSEQANSKMDPTRRERQRKTLFPYVNPFNGSLTKFMERYRTENLSPICLRSACQQDLDLLC